MTQLSSFPNGLRAAVFGATGGLGAAFLDALCALPTTAAVFAASRTAPAHPDTRVTPIPFDLTDETTIAQTIARSAQGGPLHLVIVATGLLHDGGALQPEKTWRAIDPDALARSYQVNAIGPALVAKHALPVLATDAKAVFAALSARVGSIADNRIGGWHGYRAAKAGLNMLLKNFAIELARVNKSAACIGLHPGTVDSALSAPFQRGVPEGMLFSPAYAANRLLDVIDGVGPTDTGAVFAWDGARVPG